MTIAGLQTLWGLDLPDDVTRAAALSIGSDVPFFLRGGAAVVSGRGERIMPVEGIEDVSILIVDPGFQIETSWAYRNLEIGLTEDTPYISFINSVEASGAVQARRLFQCVENDFLPVVSAHHPEVAALLQLLLATGSVCASMTGSGSALYGCYEDPELAAQAGIRVRARGYRAWCCRPINPHHPDTRCWVV